MCRGADIELTGNNISADHRALKMLVCFNPNLGQIWTNPAIGLHFLFKILTQCLNLSLFDPQLG